MSAAFDIPGFLREPRHTASVATVTPRGRPALATMWFELAEGRFWFHTPTSGVRPSPFLTAAEHGHEVAAMVATFDPPADVRQVRVTGPARLEPPEPTRVRSIYERYLDAWSEAWEAQASSDDLQLWSLAPERGMAVHYPGLENTEPVRWSTQPNWIR
ncbi:MAG: pyridoxamine 5'-phosphate oxidase family protein [Ornithinimicrobium sp.]|uniref:pyridoxamine 5'-phosphate oxidase family protein n=1 Tax=Ornithinimicrobium sp. TaxID=1977084 RepID=UPI003D9B86DF